MGTTICAAGVTDDAQLVVVNVGDSRAYLLRDGVLCQLTQDHSLTAELASTLGAGSDVHAAADALVDRAVEHGGRDNITVVVADVLA